MAIGNFFSLQIYRIHVDYCIYASHDFAYARIARYSGVVFVRRYAHVRFFQISFSFHFI